MDFDETVNESVGTQNAVFMRLRTTYTALDKSRRKPLRLKGFEPSRLAAQEPKSCTSANSVTTALELFFIEPNCARRNGLIYIFLHCYL